MSCSGDAKDFQHLKMCGSIGIAATAMLGISITWVSLSVDSDVDRYVDLCQGASLMNVGL